MWYTIMTVFNYNPRTDRKFQSPGGLFTKACSIKHICSSGHIKYCRISLMINLILFCLPFLFYLPFLPLHLLASSLSPFFTHSPFLLTHLSSLLAFFLYLTLLSTHVFSLLPISQRQKLYTQPWPNHSLLKFPPSFPNHINPTRDMNLKNTRLMLSSERQLTRSGSINTR